MSRRGTAVETMSSLEDAKVILSRDNREEAKTVPNKSTF